MTTQPAEAIPMAEPFPFGNNTPMNPETALVPRMVMPNPANIFTSIPADETGIALRLSVCGQADKLARNLLGQEIHVRYFHVSERMGQEESGDQYQGPRLILILADGTTVASSSSAVLKGLTELIACFGAKPWEPPLRVKFVGNKSSNGFEYHSLKYIGRLADNKVRRTA